MCVGSMQLGKKSSSIRLLILTCAIGCQSSGELDANIKSTRDLSDLGLEAFVSPARIRVSKSPSGQARIFVDNLGAKMILVKTRGEINGWIEIKRLGASGKWQPIPVHDPDHHDDPPGPAAADWEFVLPGQSSSWLMLLNASYDIHENDILQVIWKPQTDVPKNLKAKAAIFPRNTSTIFLKVGKTNR